MTRPMTPAQARILRWYADPSTPWRPGAGFHKSFAFCEARGWLSVGASSRLTPSRIVVTDAGLAALAAVDTAVDP